MPRTTLGKSDDSEDRAREKVNTQTGFALRPRQEQHFNIYSGVNLKSSLGFKTRHERDNTGRTRTPCPQLQGKLHQPFTRYFRVAHKRPHIQFHLQTNIHAYIQKSNDKQKREAAHTVVHAHPHTAIPSFPHNVPRPHSSTFIHPTHSFTPSCALLRRAPPPTFAPAPRPPALLIHPRRRALLHALALHVLRSAIQFHLTALTDGRKFRGNFASTGPGTSTHTRINRQIYRNKQPQPLPHTRTHPHT